MRSRHRRVMESLCCPVRNRTKQELSTIYVLAPSSFRYEEDHNGPRRNYYKSLLIFPASQPRRMLQRTIRYNNVPKIHLHSHMLIPWHSSRVGHYDTIASGRCCKVKRKHVRNFITEVRMLRCSDSRTTGRRTAQLHHIVTYLSVPKKNFGFPLVAAPINACIVDGYESPKVG